MEFIFGYSSGENKRMEIKDVKFELEPEDEGLSEDKIGKKMTDEVKATMQELDGIIESAKKRERITYLKQLIDEMRSSGYNKVADLLAEDLAEIRAQIRLEESVL